MHLMVGTELRRPIYRCPCEACCCHPSSSTALDHQAINRVIAMLDERQRRLCAGLLATRRGHGGIRAVAGITGLSRTTIRRGIAELRASLKGEGERVRRPGGGRPRTEKKIP